MTITKNSIAELIVFKYNTALMAADKETLYPFVEYHCARTVVDVMVDLITDLLLDLKTVAFKKYGKLVPSFKEGGRPVRNPLTGEPHTMHDLYTVTLSKSKLKCDSNNGKINPSQLIELLSKAISEDPYMNRRCILATLMAESAVKVLTAQMILTAETDERIEIRGFGVFDSHQLKARIARNPRTGEKVEVKAGRRPHFKIGKPLKKRMNEKYLNK